MSYTKNRIQDILEKYYSRACDRYGDYRVIATYFKQEENKIINIIIPTLGMLSSFSLKINDCDLIKDTDISAEDLDSREFSHQHLLEILNNNICIFNSEFAAAIKQGGYSAIFIRAASGLPLTDKEDINNISIFLEKTTEKEKTALRDIVERIGPEGYISLSSLIKITNISRPVYTSLLTKMKQFNIAKVTNLGVKGTKIEFLNLETLTSEL